MSVEQHEPDTNALAAYLDGRLGAAETQRVTEHLSRCAVCREMMALFARTMAAEPGLRRFTAISARARSPSAKILAFRERLLHISQSAWLPLAATLVIATVSGVALYLNKPPGSVDPGRSGSSAVTVPADAEREQPGQPAADAKQPPLPAGREDATTEQVTPERQPPQHPIDERLLVKRGAERRVGEKTFRLVAGDWVDSSFDATAALPVIEIHTREERDALLLRLPALAPYAALGDRVLVVFEGTVYRFTRRDLP